MSLVELAAYEPRHRGDYLALLREAWGEESMTGEELDWWFDRNPAGSLRSVALAGGRVVGVAGHTFLRMVVGGEERLVSFSVHATTHESARGQGIFTALERRHEQQAAERGVACVLAFASKPTAPIFLGPLEWTEIARLRVWARPLVRVRARAEAARELGGVGDAASSWPSHVIRDERHLRWRYLDSPRPYTALRAGEGYAVVGRKPWKGARAATLVDLVATGGDRRELLRRAIGASEGCRLLVGLPGPDEHAAFAAAGFVPTTYRLRLMGKGLARPLDANGRNWRFTLGDTDFF